MMNLVEKKKYILYVFPVGSIISIIVAFIFPVITYETSPSVFYQFWIYGFPYFSFESIIILDVPQKIISIIIVGIAVLTTRSIFLQRKYPDRLESISNQWLWMGVATLVLLLLWIVSWFFIVPFFANYGFIFEFIFFLPFIGGLLLIVGRISFVRIFAERNDEQNYTQLIEKK